MPFFPHPQSMEPPTRLDDTKQMNVFSSETQKSLGLDLGPEQDLLRDHVRDAVSTRRQQNGGVYLHKYSKDRLYHYSPVPQSNLDSDKVGLRTNNPPDVCLTVADLRQNFLHQHPQMQHQEQIQQPAEDRNSALRLSPRLQGEASSHQETVDAKGLSHPEVVSSGKKSHLLMGKGQQQDGSPDYHLSKKQREVHKCSTTGRIDSEVGLLQQQQFQQDYRQEGFNYPQTHSLQKASIPGKLKMQNGSKHSFWVPVNIVQDYHRQEQQRSFL